MQQKSATINSNTLNQEKADSVTLLYSSNGMLKAKLNTKVFEHVMDAKPPYIQMSKGLKVQFFNGSQPTSTLTALNGRYFENDNNVLLRDSVKVVNDKLETLETNELIWNEKSQTFHTDKQVSIATSTQIIYGDGLEANQDFTTYKILKPKGIISVKKGLIPAQ